MSATRCNRSARYAKQSGIAAIMDGRPEASALATYPCCPNTRRHELGNKTRPRFAMKRVQIVRPGAGALVYHWPCDDDATRCARGVGS
eukprot:242629-Lingulodinium_polyedra.AAC.1